VRPTAPLGTHYKTKRPIFSLALKAEGLAIGPKALKKYGLQDVIGLSPVGCLIGPLEPRRFDLEIDLAQFVRLHKSKSTVFLACLDSWQRGNKLRDQLDYGLQDAAQIRALQCAIRLTTSATIYSTN
jgi:hypothetical protein